MVTWDVFLGGHDLEMVEIARLLATRDDVEVHDKGLAWGAKVSDYGTAPIEALESGRRVVLVELADDLPADFPRGRVTFVDHHGAAAGADRPTSIEQVLELLGFPREAWTRDLELVAANVRGHIAGLRRAGARNEAIRDIRDRDRRAQGITVEEELLGREAAGCSESRLDGRPTIVLLPHDRTATVTDALDPALGDQGYRNLLVLGPKGTHVFGQGLAIQTLQRLYPQSWSGGELPERGFWAPTSPSANQR